MSATMAAEACIVVDVQQAFICGSSAVPDHARLQQQVSLLLARARAAGALIIFLQNDGPTGALDEPHQTGWELYFPARADEYVLRKKDDDGFSGTHLQEILTSFGVHTLALCGVLSEMCVAATARTAMGLGYTVVLPHDGHATYDVPAGPGGSESVPATMAARAAEWSLGDEVVIVPSVSDVRFLVK